MFEVEGDKMFTCDSRLIWFMFGNQTVVYQQFKITKTTYIVKGTIHIDFNIQKKKGGVLRSSRLEPRK